MCLVWVRVLSSILSYKYTTIAQADINNKICIVNVTIAMYLVWVRVLSSILSYRYITIVQIDISNKYV